MSQAPDEKPAPSAAESIAVELARANELLEMHIAVHRDWKLALRNGLLAGLGGVIGATLVVSILLAILRPLQRLESLGSVFERIEQELKKR